MIRKKISADALMTTKVSRNGPYGFSSVCSYVYPLHGQSQAISDSRATFTKQLMPKRVRRVKRDPLGNVVKKVERAKRKNAWRLQPFTMNPVLIHNFESRCKKETVTFPDTWGTITVEGSLGATDYGIKVLANPNVTTIVWAPTQVSKNRAIIKCLEKLSAPKVLDAGVGIAELKATLEFLKSPLKSVVNLFAKHRRSTYQRLNKIKVNRRPTTRELVDAASDTWLSYRYAFSPLASDISGLMIEMTEKLDTSSKILRRVSGRDKVETVEPIRQINPSGWCGNASFYIFGEVRESTVQTTTAVQLYHYRPFFNDAIKLASLGLSPTQLVSLGWELVPFSFVADWVVDVGGWLRAWEPKPWIQLQGSCVSTVTEKIITVSNVKCGNYYNPVPCKNDAFARAKQLYRTVETLTLPKSPPITKEALNLFRSLDTLSLGWKPISAWASNFTSKRK